MKTMQTLLLALALTGSSAIFATTTEPTSDDKPVKPVTINTEVGKMLDKHKFDFKHDVETMVTFTVNKENEIVVLDVKTDDPQIENYIKSRLNYQKLTSPTKKNINYFMPVKLEKLN